MAKDFSKYQQGVVKRYYEHQETIRSERLSDLVAEIWLCEDKTKATKLWGRAQIALMKAGCTPTQAASVVGKGDVEALAKLVQEIDRGANNTPQAEPQTQTPPARGAQSVADGRTIGQMQRDKAAAGGYDSLEPANLKRAMNAFKRKLKNFRRDDESQLRGRYTTRGEASRITAISPPREFPPAVWQELVRQGRLKSAGQGTYQIS